MDRERRLANLRKLQLPGTRKRANCNIASNGTIVSTATTLITTAAPTATAVASTVASNYFHTTSKQSTSCAINNPAPQQQRQQQQQQHCNIDEHMTTSEPGSRPHKRTKLDAFIYRNPKQITNHKTPCKSPKNDDDFIIQSERIKKAPQSKKSKGNVKKSALRNHSNRVKSKKQSTLKSAFLRNEQMFAEIAAQHCAVEQFDGDEIQMALALSKSEMNNFEENCETEYVEADSNNLENVDDVREKLQKYGFRTASKKDYQTYAANFWSAPNRRKGKCKWANKFTALTLRNPAVQNEKLQQKIECTLNQQRGFPHENSMEHSAPFTYTMISSILKQCHQHDDDRTLMRRNVQDDNVKLEDYFVEELFTINHLPCGYLLKNWSMIPGRSKSPAPIHTDATHTSVKIKTSLTNVKLLQNAYKDLEIHEQSNRNSQADQDNMNELDVKEASVKDIQSQSSQSQSVNEMKQLQQIALDNVAMDLMPVSSCSIKAEATCNSLSSQQRLSSPDLFGDSDVEMPVYISPCKEAAEHEIININNEEEHVNSKFMEGANDVTTYELFTSDDVKNFNNSTLVKEDEVLILKTPNKWDKEKPNIIGETFEENNAKKISLSYDREKVKKEYTRNSSPCIKFFQDMAQSLESNVNIEDEDEIIFKKLREKYLGDMLIKAQVNAQNSITSNININEVCTTLSPSSSLSSLSLPSPRIMLNQKVEACSSNLNPSPLIKSDTSIDLTQNENPVATMNVNNSSKDDDDFIILSDDDINYSIWKTSHQKSSSITGTQSDTNSDINENNEDFNFTFLTSPSERTTTIMKQQQSKEKFHIFLSNEELPMVLPSSSSPSLKNCQNNEINALMDFHEFDRQLIYKSNSAINNSFDNMPQGLDKLLNGELKFLPNQSAEYNTISVIQKTEKTEETDKIAKTARVQQIQIQDKTFMVRIDAIEKPDFARMTDAELLKHLYDIGVKPLKRRHSIKLLEYIYNQTHPIIVNNTAENSKNSLSILHTSSPPKRTTWSSSCNDISNKSGVVENCSNTKKSKKLILHDASGTDILNSRITLKPELVNEKYILQTNVNKKTPQPLLPFHIAWYNLVCSNYNLYETILMYEPIDLQDVYLFLKNLGYRYDPKDMKNFFDERCIIFRYDLGAYGNEKNAGNRERQRNRQIRRIKSKN